MMSPTGIENCESDKYWLPVPTKAREMKGKYVKRFIIKLSLKL